MPTGLRKANLTAGYSLVLLVGALLLLVLLTRNSNPNPGTPNADGIVGGILSVIAASFTLLQCYLVTPSP